MPEGSPTHLDLLLPTDPGRPAQLDVADLAAHYAYPAAAPGRCWVRANMVASLDGAAAGGGGRSAALSTPADRRVFHLLRGLADVVVVGAGTARSEGYGPVAEHPDLADAREAQGRRRSAVLVQLSRSGRAHAGRGTFANPGDAYVVVAQDDSDAVDAAVDSAGAASVLLAPSASGGGPDLAVVLAMLAARGLTRVLCEGGPSLLDDLVAADLLDELCLTTSPLLGGGSQLRLLGGQGSDTRRMRLAGLLHADSALLGRWVRDRPMS